MLRKQTSPCKTKVMLPRWLGAKPQCIMRSTLIFGGTPAVGNALLREQRQMPNVDGGFAAGGVMEKAPAAFAIGAMSAMGEIHAAAGTMGV